jgi:hypothetical protein
MARSYEFPQRLHKRRAGMPVPILTKKRWFGEAVANFLVGYAGVGTGATRARIPNADLDQ